MKKERLFVLWWLIFGAAMCLVGYQWVMWRPSKIMNCCEMTKVEPIISTEIDDKEVYQVVVVGGGVAGMTAGMYGARSGMEMVIVSDGAGELAMSELVENYPGVPPIPGIDLLSQISKQATGMGAVKKTARVTKINTSSRPFAITTASETFYSHSLIIATGASPRWTNAEGELALRGKYIHSCPLCDGFIYAGKDVLVIGGGDSAVEAAMYLSKICSSVTIVHRRTTWRATAVSVVRMKATDQITQLLPFVVSSFIEINSKVVVTFKSVTNSEKIERTFSGVFVAIGSAAATNFLPSDVETDRTGHVKVYDRTGSTSINGIFAAGEVIDTRYKQAVTAAASGAMSAIEVEGWLTERGLLSKKSKYYKRPTPPLVTPPPPVEKTSNASSDGFCEKIAVSCINKYVKEHDVVIFSKTYCPYCTSAKSILTSLKVDDVVVVELDTSPRGAELHKFLITLTGRRTVPNIFIKGRNVGGYDELSEELPILNLLLKKKDN